MKKPQTNGEVSRPVSVRLKLPVYRRLNAQAKKEKRPMANLIAVFIQAGLDDRNRGARL